MKKILFLGDSLTDMWRNRERNMEVASNYGTGYVFDITGQLMYENPGEYQVINQGISGNKITDLYSRYKKDVIEEKPDVLTILIGVNDVWHGLTDPSLTTPLKTFEELYLKIIADVKSQLPNIKIFLMEPFFIHGVATDQFFEQFKDVYKYASIVKEVAKKTNSVFVPLQASFDKHSKGAEEQFLYDGVHTNPAGAYLIAQEWLKAFKK